MLDFEIRRSDEHPAVWEKKGASLFTVMNLTRYRALQQFTNRLFNKIERLGGFVFYVAAEGLTVTEAAAAKLGCTRQTFSWVLKPESGDHEREQRRNHTPDDPYSAFAQTNALP